MASASHGAARSACRAGSQWVLSVAVAVAVGVVLALACGRSYAAQDLLSGISGLRLGVGASDNIDRTDQPISGEWLEAGLAGNFLETRPNFDGQLTSDVSYRRYNAKDIGDEFVGGAIGHASFNLFDNVLKWVADDIYGKSSINAYGPNSPQN
ncbi:MAG TPA: hypothetical protein VN676_15440, partial [Steroidobacteraceae bacterium]|nr:hypothetical protein [Steroidobacteraceae bacterium]